MHKRNNLLSYWQDWINPPKSKSKDRKLLIQKNKMMILRLCKRRNQLQWKLKNVKIKPKLMIRLKNKVNQKRNKSLLNNNKNSKESRITKRRTETKIKKAPRLKKITVIKMEKEKIIIKNKWTIKINLKKAPKKDLSQDKTVSKKNHQRISSIKLSTRKKQRWVKNDKV